MPMTALELTPDALKKYRPMEAILHRREISRAGLARHRRAGIAARKAAELLYREFGAEKVFVFGSLARRGVFTPWSDIDLAARGIPPDRFFEAVGMVTGISPEFKIDLIDLDTCKPSLRDVIEIEGKAY